MDFPKGLLDAIGFTKPKEVRPIVFMRANSSNQRVHGINPDSTTAQVLRTYLKAPTDSNKQARRVFRQAIVLRTVGGKLKHYPLWALFSNETSRDSLAMKYNQESPDRYWVKRKRLEVCEYLKVRVNFDTLETVDSLAKDLTCV